MYDNYLLLHLASLFSYYFSRLFFFFFNYLSLSLVSPFLDFSRVCSRYQHLIFPPLIFLCTYFLGDLIPSHGFMCNLNANDSQICISMPYFYPEFHIHKLNYFFFLTFLLECCDYNGSIFPEIHSSLSLIQFRAHWT